MNMGWCMPPLTLVLVSRLCGPVTREVLSPNASESRARCVNEVVIRGGVMQRFGQVIGIKPDQIEAYETLHRAVWPEVCAIMSAHHMRNYSIFRHATTL